jgi:hypothetical protein
MSTADRNGADRPAGKSALFSAPQPPSEPVRRGEGRQALFSAPPRRRGTVIVECDRCEARTPVPLVELGVRLLPSLWVPGKSFSRLMRCPSCTHRTWCRIHWRDALG